MSGRSNRMTERVGHVVSAYPVCEDRLPERTLREGRYEVRFARSQSELDAILRLRFEIFNLELGEGLESSYATGLDLDEFDAVCHHLMVLDATSGEIVGSYRLQTSGMARQHLGFYCETEFDLSTLPPEVLDRSLEIGRACVSRSHRSSHVLFLLWKGLARYVAANGKRYLFGCSSLTSQNPLEGKALMNYLEANGHVHSDLAVQPQPGYECYDETLPERLDCRRPLGTAGRQAIELGCKLDGHQLDPSSGGAQQPRQARFERPQVDDSIGLAQTCE